MQPFRTKFLFARNICLHSLTEFSISPEPLLSNSNSSEEPRLPIILFSANNIPSALSRSELILCVLSLSAAVSVSVSVWTLVAISVERYYAICHPLRSRRWQTLSHAYRLIAAVWTGSLLLMTPVAALSELQPTSQGVYYASLQFVYFTRWSGKADVPREPNPLLLWEHALRPLETLTATWLEEAFEN